MAMMRIALEHYNRLPRRLRDHVEDVSAMVGHLVQEIGAPRLRAA